MPHDHVAKSCNITNCSGFTWKLLPLPLPSPSQLHSLASCCIFWRFWCSAICSLWCPRSSLHRTFCWSPLLRSLQKAIGGAQLPASSHTCSHLTWSHFQQPFLNRSHFKTWNSAAIFHHTFSLKPFSFAAIFFCSHFPRHFYFSLKLFSFAAIFFCSHFPDTFIFLWSHFLLQPFSFAAIFPDTFIFLWSYFLLQPFSTTLFLWSYFLLQPFSFAAISFAAIFPDTFIFLWSYFLLQPFSFAAIFHHTFSLKLFSFAAIFHHTFSLEPFYAVLFWSNFPPNIFPQSHFYICAAISPTPFVLFSWCLFPAAISSSHHFSPQPF